MHEAPSSALDRPASVRWRLCSHGGRLGIGCGRQSPPCDAGLSILRAEQASVSFHELTGVAYGPWVLSSEWRMMALKSEFTKRYFWRVTAVFLAAAPCWSSAESPSRPNIILIVADDLGINQVGAYGGKLIQTPNLDSLAANGIRFTQAYSGSTVCSPSRISLFTGRDSRLMKDNSNAAQLEETDATLAHVLKQASYSTALFGKYSIGSQMGITDPLAIGFDTWFGMYSILEGHRQYPWMLWEDGHKVRITENEGGKKGVYCQELFA